MEPSRKILNIQMFIKIEKPRVLEPVILKIKGIVPSNLIIIIIIFLGIKFLAKWSCITWMSIPLERADNFFDETLSEASNQYQYIYICK
jgi:hypothetical protein